MATRTVTPRAARAPLPRYLEDDYEACIRAFLATMQPLRATNCAVDEEYQRGRAVIERMALDCRGREYEWPRLRLTAAECAEVLEFLSDVEPIAPRTWWLAPEAGGSPVVGFHIVLNTLKSSLEAAPSGLRQGGKARRA